MKSVVSWFAENHVAANLLMIFFLLAGVVTGLRMKMEIFPEISLDRISITTVYPGASPAEVEESVLRPVEEKVAGISGIKRIDSIAREGYGAVTLEVMQGWDLKSLLDEVKAAVDRMTTFPKEAEKPVIREVTRRIHVISLALYGNVSEATLKHLAQRIRDDITHLPGITVAEISGVRNSEIHIEIPEKTLRRYGLTLRQVADAVKNASLDLPAGSVKAASGEILIRTKGRRYHALEYRDVAVLTQPDGSKVTLGQIARLKEGFEDVDLASRFMEQPAVIINVYRVGGQNVLKVASAVKQYVAGARDRLPAGVKMDVYRDRSRILKGRLRLLLKNMAWGLILVSLLLGGFLDRRLAFWVTLGIPVSFLAGVWALPYFDVSINMISLFAFIMVLGIVVDDAIVIGENIHRKHEDGYDAVTASIEGTLEVGRPVIFAVLTTVAAFWPLLIGTGAMGKRMSNIPVVVILVLFGSLIEALFILPAHLEGSRRKAVARHTARKEKRAAKALRWVIEKPYTKALSFCVRWRYATVAAGLALLFLAWGVWKGGGLKFTFFPQVESDTLVLSLTMPVGTPMAQTLKTVRRLEQSARAAMAEADRGRPKDAPPLLQYTASLVGRHVGGGPHGGKPDVGSHLAQVYVQLLDGERRRVSAAELARRWREKVGRIPEAKALNFKSALFSAGNAVEVHLSMEDPEQLLAAVEALKSELGGIPGIHDVQDSFLPGKNEVQLKLKPAARTLGLTLSDLAGQVRHAFYGAEALRFQRGQDEVKVLVRYPKEERRSLGHLEAMRIRTPSGHAVPFGQVAKVHMARGYASIERAQRMRVIKVMADVNEKVANANEVRHYLETQYLPDLRNRFFGLRYTMEGEGKEQKDSMADVIHAFTIALFAIYALLAIPFKSFTQPVVVMAAIPFGIIGAMAGHLIMGLNLSLLSLLGMVGLSGVVVNDSLVLIDMANRLRARGMTPKEAVFQAGRRRFRAIILTSLTTFAGLTPMIFERSVQARFLIPMAVSLGFGVLFATGITLILIPCGFLILEDLHGVRSSLLTNSPAR